MRRSCQYSQHKFMFFKFLILNLCVFIHSKTVIIGDTWFYYEASYYMSCPLTAILQGLGMNGLTLVPITHYLAPTPLSSTPFSCIKSNDTIDSIYCYTFNQTFTYFLTSDHVLAKEITNHNQYSGSFDYAFSSDSYALTIQSNILYSTLLYHS